MVMTSGFEETKSAGEYNIVQRKNCSQRQNWIWFSVQPERIEKLPGEKNNNKKYIHISTICTIVVDGLFIWKDVISCAFSITSSFE